MPTEERLPDLTLVGSRPPFPEVAAEERNAILNFSGRLIIGVSPAYLVAVDTGHAFLHS